MRSKGLWTLLLAAGFALSPGLARAQSTVVTLGQTHCRQVALTFDAGATADSATGILEAHASHRFRSTFFLTGNWVDDFPVLAERVANEGHEVANHTDTHPSMPTLSTAAMRSELRSAEQKILARTGVSPRPHWRPPYGDYNATVLQVAGEEGYPWTLMWDIDTIDWQHPPAQTIADRVLTRVRPGSVVLMHMGGVNTAEAVRIMVPELERRGYMMVTVSEVLGLNRATADFGGRVVYVQSGDSLSKIAGCFNSTVPILAAANDISNPDLIAPGSRIYVPLRDEVTVRVNGAMLLFQTPARVVNGRTMAHVRPVADALGATVGWNAASEQITVTKGSTTVVMTIGSSTATVNGTPVTLDASPYLQDSRTQVPLRFLAEVLGATVTWDPESRTARVE